MNHRKYLVTVGFSVVLATVAFGQQTTTTTTTAPAPTTAPAAEVAPEMPSSSDTGWKFGLSYDYFGFRSERGIVSVAEEYWAQGTQYSNLDATSSGSLNGGTLSIGKGNWDLDVTVRDGNSTLDQSFSQAAIGGGSFASKISLKDTTADGELHYNFKNSIRDWFGYASIGLFYWKTDDTYNYINTADPSTNYYVPALSGTEYITYGSLGLGVARQFTLSDSAFLSLKFQASALLGNGSALNKTSAANGGLGGSNQSNGSTNTTSWVYGAKGDVTLRLSFVPQHSNWNFGLEGGGEGYDFTDEVALPANRTIGFLLRAFVQYSH